MPSIVVLLILELIRLGPVGNVLRLRGSNVRLNIGLNKNADQKIQLIET